MNKKYISVTLKNVQYFKIKRVLFLNVDKVKYLFIIENLVK